MCDLDESEGALLDRHTKQVSDSILGDDVVHVGSGNAGTVAL